MYGRMHGHMYGRMYGLMHSRMHGRMYVRIYGRIRGRIRNRNRYSQYQQPFSVGSNWFGQTLLFGFCVAIGSKETPVTS